MITKLIAWFQYLINEVDDIDRTVQMWQNTANHFVGQHEKCVHPSDFTTHTRGRPKKAKETYWEWTEAVNDRSYYEELVLFLTETTPLLTQIGDSSTQEVESLNASIAHSRPKTFNFSTSNAARAEIAIGIKIDSHFRSKLMAHLNPDISEEALNMMCHDEEKKQQENLKKRQKEEMRRKNELRTKERTNYKYKPGDYKHKRPLV